MGTSRFTPDEVLPIVQHMYQSIDIRAAAVREGDIWWNSLAIVRFSYLSPELADVRARESAGNLRRLETANFRIATDMRPFTDLSEIRSATEGGFLYGAGLKSRLRRSMEWKSLQ